MRVSRFVCAIACTLSVASSAVAKPAAKKKPAAAPATKATPKAPKDALLAAADEIARQVAGLRGLQLKAPLQRGVLTRDEIGAKLKDRIGKEYTAEEVHVEARVLKRLGLLPPDVDYEKLLLDLLMEQVAGFYDPFSAKLYIADWLPLEMQRPALAHEIEHALQDQHFDLKKFATPIKDDGDRQLGTLGARRGRRDGGDARVPGAGDGPAARPAGRAHRADGQAAALGQPRRQHAAVRQGADVRARDA